jgi:thiamine kinase-like enzyme
VDFLIEDLERNDDDFNVFVHGDLWVNNMMFRYSDDTDEVVDVRYIAGYKCSEQIGRSKACIDLSLRAVVNKNSQQLLYKHGESLRFSGV